MEYNKARPHPDLLPQEKELTFAANDYFKQQAAATAWDLLVEKPMSDSVYIDCPSGRSGRAIVEAIRRMIPEELDAGKTACPVR